MSKIRISKSTVDGALPGDREETHWDDRLPGFGLKVTPAGSKVYIYRYRIARPGEAAKTAPRKYTIGKHGELTPDQARKRAQELAALVVSGVDPREQEAETLAARDRAERQREAELRLENDLAFSRIADLWLDYYEHEKKRRASSVAMARMVVRRHLKPAFGNKPMPHVDQGDLQAIIDAIPITKQARRRNVFAYASILCGWAARRRYIAANPLTSMEKPEASEARDRVLDDQELVSLWKGTEVLPSPWGPFYRLLLLTGQRKSEVAGMGWDELDRLTLTWTIPVSRSKNKAAHVVPLSKGVIAELDAMVEGKPWPKTGYVLTTTGRTPISGFSKAKKALDSLIAGARSEGALPAWRVHDLRRTVATGFQKLGARFEVTEAVLNHISGAKAGVAGIYQRHDWKDEKKAALSAWATHVSELVKDAADRREGAIEETAA